MHIAMTTTRSQIGEKLEAGRKRAHLSRAQVAEIVGVDPQTVYRWERDERRVPGEAMVRMLEAYGMKPTELGLDIGTLVPRGTPALRESSPPYVTAGRFEPFLRELIRLGATDEEVDFVADVLRRPETGRLIKVGVDAQPLPDAAVDEQWAALLDDFRALIKRRIARRAGGPTLDSAEIERAGLAGLRPPTPEERARGGAADAEAPRPAARKSGKRVGRGR